MYGIELLVESSTALQANVVEISQSINAVWVLIVSFLIFFMQPGFALLEAGQVRAKNVANVTMKNMMDWSLGLLGYFLIGLAVASLVGMVTSPGPISISAAFAYVNDPSAWIDWLFGAVFAMTAATIVSGAVAGRIKFGTYVGYSVLVATVIYPVIQGLTWSGGLLSADGFLGQLLGAGYMDFAGGTIVHMTGGIAGLIAAGLVGPRIGRFTDGESNPIPGHSVFLAMLGTFVLAFGWYGFNVGTQATVLTESGTFNGAALGRVALVTTLGMAGGTVASAIVTTIDRGDPDPLFTANGMLAGLVAVTAAAAHVTWWGGLILGLIGGATVMPVHNFVIERFQIDDVCGVFAVHGAPGAAGAALIPLFAVGPNGSWQIMGLNQFLIQILGIAVISAWAVGATWLTFRGMQAVLGFDLRVDDDDEESGLDASEHSIAAYPEFAIADGGVEIDSDDDEDASDTESPPQPGPSPSAEASGTMWRGQEVGGDTEETVYSDVDSIAEAVARPALVVDSTGTVVAANDRMLALFDLTAEDVLDSPLGFNPGVESAVGDVVDAVAGNREPVVDRTVAPEESGRTLSVSGNKLRTSATDGVLVTLADVTDRTERKRRREALIDYRDELLADHREQLDRLAAGRLNVDSGVTPPAEEFEELTAAQELFETLDEAIVTVAEDVRAIVEQLPDQSAALARKSASLSESGQEVMRAAEQTDDLSTEIETEVRRLTEQATGVRDNIEDQSAAIQQISASAAQIETQSSKAADLTHTAVDDVGDAVEEIRAATEASEEVLSEIDDLEARMNDVSDIVDIITDIAEQTNMLALNASIEAAHADADGDGFAVVADEVKSLAEEAQSQAADIAKIVESAEEQTADVIAQIRAANTEVSERTEALTDVVHSLEEAQEYVSETNHGVSEITDAVERQAETATTITEIIEETSTLAGEIDDKVQRISTNADEQSSTLTSVAGTADDISDLAAEVDANVDAFDASQVINADD